MSDDSRSDSDVIVNSLRPLLVELSGRSIELGSVDAAQPLIDKAAHFLAVEYVESMRETAVAAFNEGLKAGLERTGTPLQ